MIILQKSRKSRELQSAIVRHCEPEHFFAYIRTIVLNISNTAPAAITKRTLR